MSASFSRRSKVLLALVASMTLCTSLLLGLRPEPMQPLKNVHLIGLSDSQPAAPPAEQAVKQDQTPQAGQPTPTGPAWQRIVVHESGQSPDGVAEMDTRYQRYGGCIYHFVINTDGSVESTERWRSQQPVPADLHHGKTGGIHIALVGRFDRKPPTAPQLKSYREVRDRLADYYGIPGQAVDVHPDVNSPGVKFRP